MAKTPRGQSDKRTNWFEDKMLKDQRAQDELTGGPTGKWTK